METEYCDYPPQIASDVETVEGRDGERLAYIVGSSAAGRHLLIHSTEYQVLRLLQRSLPPAGICAEFERECGRPLSLAVLTKFMAKLDDSGILSGRRATVRGTDPSDSGSYLRFKLFDPDRLFTRMVCRLRWIWTPGFVVFSLALMAAALLLTLMNWAQVSSYGLLTLREHYLAIFVAGTLVVFTHEFAHGLTCKAFGGPVREVGALLIYYFLPALYCNVSGVHFIPQRSRRLWVIAAGVYWQVLVSTVALLAWFIFAPQTLPADLAFIVFLGGIVDVIFNANPLIKLDGYYFLSQWLRMPNLMDRSRIYWRAMLRRFFLGEREDSVPQRSSREQWILAAFGLASFIYSVGLRVFIVCYLGSYLTDRFQFIGLMLAASLAIFYIRPWIYFRRTLENVMSNATKLSLWRRHARLLATGLLAAGVVVMPWNASVGNYGTLVAIPGEESIIRAPENATLVDLSALPGVSISTGAMLGRMGNIDLEEQLTQLQSELARATADRDRLAAEVRVLEESALSAKVNLRQRQVEYADVNGEQQQINARRSAEARREAAGLLTSLDSSSAIAGAVKNPIRSAVPYPPAIAMLAADVDLHRSKQRDADAELERARRLFSEGLLARRDLESSETRASTVALEAARTDEQLESALIEHRRKHVLVGTDLELARSNAGAAILEIDKRKGELAAARAFIGTLEERRRLLEVRRGRFDLMAPRSGTIFGEELPRMVGQFFPKGAEICRIADTRQLLLRIQVPELQIGDVTVGDPVRLRTRSFPDRVFRGVVSSIGSESETGQYDQTTYRVELVIDNGGGALRPGMTAFARIDFGRQMIGRILLHKIRQALRPELWML